MLTNVCIWDCAYCINRKSSNVRRARFTAEEVVQLTLAFYKRNYIEGLFLSSGIIRSPDYTMEQVVEVARRLREDHGFHDEPGTDLAAALLLVWPAAHAFNWDRLSHLAQVRSAEPWRENGDKLPEDKRTELTEALDEDRRDAEAEQDVVALDVRGGLAVGDDEDLLVLARPPLTRPGLPAKA